jgi:hypothetical protein
MIRRKASWRRRRGRGRVCRESEYYGCVERDKFLGNRDARIHVHEGYTFDIRI